MFNLNALLGMDWHNSLKKKRVSIFVLMLYSLLTWGQDILEGWKKEKEPEDFGIDLLPFIFSAVIAVLLRSCIDDRYTTEMNYSLEKEKCLNLNLKKLPTNFLFQVCQNKGLRPVWIM